MVISKPIGEVRYNHNTYLKEVWDGKDWNPIDDPNNFVTIPVHNLSGTVSTTITTASIMPDKITTERKNEDLFEFLKKNLRVAEYLDENGKVDHVQLELRADEGYIWENISRVRIKT